MTTAQPTPIAELLARLNALRADLGQQPLKAWKDGRAKLETAIHNAKVAAQAKLDAKVADAEQGSLEEHPLVKEEKAKAPKKAAAKKAETKATPAGDTFTLAELARELKVNPKVARAKARRHAKELTPLKVAGADGWTFSAKAKAEVTKIIKA